MYSLFFLFSSPPKNKPISIYSSKFERHNIRVLIRINADSGSLIGANLNAMHSLELVLKPSIGFLQPSHTPLHLLISQSTEAERVT